MVITWQGFNRCHCCVDTSLRGKTVSFDEAISGVCYYFMSLPYSLRLLAMTEKLIHAGNENKTL